MKSKITLLLFSMLFVSNILWSQKTTTPSLILSNVTTKKSVNVCNKVDPDKLEAILGKCITLDKDVDSGEEPVYTFNYNGLVIEMQNNTFKQITITSKNWKFAGFSAGTLVDKIGEKYEETQGLYATDNKFKINSPKAIISAEIDKFRNITKLIITFN